MLKIKVLTAYSLFVYVLCRIKGKPFYTLFQNVTRDNILLTPGNNYDILGTYVCVKYCHDRRDVVRGMKP
jgi:hypothetical protein